MTSTKKWLMVLILLGVLLPVVFALRTLQAQETELILLKPQVVDLDNDQIHYSYSAPFDEQGEWQTDYDDAGEYTVEVTASDGVEESKEKLRVIIKNKNQPPRLLEKKITVKETQIADIKKLVSDADADDAPDTNELQFHFSPPFDQQGIWKTGYDDEGTYKITFSVSDGEFTEEFMVEVEVLHTNQPPKIKNYFSKEQTITLKEDDTLKYFAEAEDEDEEQTFYRWMLDGKNRSEESSGELHFSFDEAGRHVLQLRVSDGQKETLQQWNLEVKNVNRKPELELLPMSVYEGEAVVIELPETDADGEQLQYEFPKFFTSEGIWQTGYADAGKYTISIVASDGELEGTGILEVTVLDVDRAPQLNLPREVRAKEGEPFLWHLEAFDPDGDALKFRFENFPETSVFNPENATISWTPEYDFICRSGNFRSNLINALRLEQYFLRQRKIPLTIVVCGKELCSTSQISMIVENSNRAPVFDALPDLQVIATELARLEVSATDPDGDKVYYYFTEPFHKQKGTWKTTFTDVGVHTVYVTATDGRQETTAPLNITILKNNRIPKVKLSHEKVKVEELEEFTLHVDAVDKDGDTLTLALENLPKEASFKEGIFVWKPDITTVKTSREKKSGEETETLWLRFTASDGEANVTAPVKVTVRNVNQAPEIFDYLPAGEKESRVGEPVLFHIAAKDADGDVLQYRWDFGLGEKSAEGTDTIERTFTSPGKKKVKVTVTDGKEKTEKEFFVVVKEAEVEKVALAEPKVQQQTRESADSLVAYQQQFTIGVYVIEG